MHCSKRRPGAAMVYSITSSARSWNSRLDATQLLRAAHRRYALGRFSVFEARKPCAAASFSHM
jgi:hypothetical protein